MKQLLDVGRVLEAVLLGLGHLADLFLESHSGHQRLHLRVEGGQGPR